MPHRTCTLFVMLLTGCLAAAAPAAAGDPPAPAADAVVAPVLYQPSMNVFRRFDTDADRMYAFYRDVLGLEQLTSFGGVARFQAGASEFKLTRRVRGKEYRPGGVRDATGLRVVTFFFPEEAALIARFVKHGHAAPEFQTDTVRNRRVALVQDPDGQPVELVVVPNTPQVLDRIEIGLTVSDIVKSRAFYRSFVGLDELPPFDDPRFGTRAYPFRHGSTTIILRSFGAGLPADTGSGGIQYVVSNVTRVDDLAKARQVRIDQALTAAPDAGLRTVWLEDPDGITNYFAETTWSRPAASSRARD